MSRGAEFSTIDTSLKQQFDGHWNIKKKKEEAIISFIRTWHNLWNSEE